MLDEIIALETHDMLYARPPWIQDHCCSWAVLAALIEKMVTVQRALCSEMPLKERRRSALSDTLELEASSVSVIDYAR